MIASFRAGVAEANEKFKGLQAFSFFFKDVILPQCDAAVVIGDDRIVSTCNLISSFPLCSTPLVPIGLAKPRQLWQNSSRAAQPPRTLPI